MSKTIYLTTPLYYVNAAPHIGHSYTNVAADCMSRYFRLRGEGVFLLTGTDEHGQKIEQAAVAAGQTPQAFVDGVSKHFVDLWKLLDIRYDDFIRTTQPRHQEAVKQILAKLHKEGKLIRGGYQGWYCTPDETFWTEAELSGAASDSQPLCPSCQRPLERIQEEGWHLPLEAHRPWLLKFVKEHPSFIRPQSRYNELMSVLEQPLPEALCITRPKSRVKWGIEVPFDPNNVVYVWIDALLNYITVPGYKGEANPGESFRKFWPADVHFIGKDILRHHALYWPILLHALGFTDAMMPKTIIAHGWWKIGEQKMSKSLGNIVDPRVVVTQLLKGQPHAADVYRYFLLREVPFGQDGSFSEEAIFKRLSSDLANDLGNLVNRTCSMIERYCEGKIPRIPPLDQLDVIRPQQGMVGHEAPVQPQRILAESALALPASMIRAMKDFQFSVALEAIMRLVMEMNQYIEATAPWKLAKDGGDIKQLHQVLAVLAEVLRIVAILLEPFMPGVSSSIWQQLGCSGERHFADAARWGLLPEGQRLGKASILFPKLETAQKI